MENRELKHLQVWIDADIFKLLKEQKSKQKRSMALIVENLIFDKYGDLRERLKNLED